MGGGNGVRAEEKLLTQPEMNKITINISSVTAAKKFLAL